MDLNSITLEAARAKRVAILGYGNQGRAHALNLRDSGVSVQVGARPGVGFDLAVKDGFKPVSFEAAIQGSQVVMYLLPDHVIPEIYRQTQTLLKSSHFVGFAHGFCYHYGWIDVLSHCQYFLVGSKGAGAILRDAFERGSGLPGVFAVGKENSDLENFVKSYAKAVGLASQKLVKTTFQEETECDLFGEQAVLCGGLMQLMEASFEVLVEEGLNPEMAFLECCYEAQTIIQLWMKYGPYGMTQRISPTAFYGGITRGKRLIDDSTRVELKKIFREIRSGDFAKEWRNEVEGGTVLLNTERERLKDSKFEKVYCSIFQRSSLEK